MSSERGATEPIAERRAADGAPRDEKGVLQAADWAWLLLVPCAAIAAGLIFLLGPPLGDVLFPSDQFTFWPSVKTVLPEPTEQARYLLALAAALLVPTAVAVASRLRVRRAPWHRWARVGSQLALIAFVVVCVIAQRRIEFPIPRVYFDAPALLFAVVFAVAAIAVAGSAAARARLARIPRGLWPCTAAAAVLTGLWLLHAIQLDSTVAHSPLEISFHVQFPYDETLAVINGRSPLVDFAAQYGSLWPYVVAGPLDLLGGRLGPYSLLVCSVTLLALLAVYDVLRRVSRHPLAGLALFVPFVATSFFLIRGVQPEIYTFGAFYGVFPMRYAGPYFLVFLLTRHLDGARPRSLWPIFLVAGFVVLNNGDFGLPALGATVVALLAAQAGRWSRPQLGRFALEAAAGLLAAFALVSLLTLIRTGSFPHIELLFRYARIFATGGYGMLPMPTLGMNVVLYLTFAGALAVAAVRVVQRASDRVLTGLLGWSGIFGLGAGSYYVGRSHPDVLIALFSAWAMALALLTIVVLRATARSARLRPSPAQFLTLVGFGLAVCSIAQFPRPWVQVERLQNRGAYVLVPGRDARFVESRTRPGESVVIISSLGHRTALAAGVTNVALYTGILSMPTEEQLDETRDALREAGGDKVFLSRGDEWFEVPGALERAGFRRVGADLDTPLRPGEVPGGGVELWEKAG